ncbi:MAG: DinB family protein [Mucilaginibacter sp.]|nr:DinB family protein [Mucilaginibacter sp.]
MNLYLALTDRLKTQHESIPVIIADVDRPGLEWHPSPGKWSIHDNIAHLASYQPLFISRMNKIADQDAPVFERYNADADPEFPGWQSRKTVDLVEQLFIDRETILTLITGLRHKQLSRMGTHPKFGKMTIIEWTEFFLLHEAHHLFTIFQLARSEKA